MNYYELKYDDYERIKSYRKKYGIFRYVTQFFCGHNWKRNGTYASCDYWICSTCGKSYSQELLAGDHEPISYINENLNKTIK